MGHKQFCVEHGMKTTNNERTIVHLAATQQCSALLFCQLQKKSSMSFGAGSEVGISQEGTTAASVFFAHFI